jgi:tetratricopeptide (TPR) repeat protein
VRKAAREAGDDGVASAAQCRQLIRNCGTPHRLHSNRLAQTLLERVGGDRPARNTLEELLERALSRVSTRERGIIRRCDIDGELHARVAKELGISERHLYRQRQRILQKIAALLLDPPSEGTRIGINAVDSIEQLIRTSRVLEENGAHAVAAEIIEKRAGESVDALERSRLFLHLASLHARSGLLARADESLSTALRHAGHDPRRDRVLDAEMALTHATVLEEAAKGEPLVAELAEESIGLVRSSDSVRYDPMAAGILVKALSLRALVACFSGDFARLHTTASEICNIQPLLSEGDPDSQMAALYAQGLANLLCENNLNAALHSVGRAMQIAQGAGLSISSIMLAVDLASLYRVRRKADEAIAMLTPRLDVARALGNQKTLVACLIELAGAHIDVRDYLRARHLIDEAGALAEGNRALYAAFLKVSSAVHLGMKHFDEAFEESRAAAVAYAQLGKLRLVGTSLRYQADALISMGDRRGALSAIRGAVDALEAMSPRGELASAYTLLGRISGNARHLDTARKLREVSTNTGKRDRLT